MDRDRPFDPALRLMWRDALALLWPFCLLAALFAPALARPGMMLGGSDLARIFVPLEYLEREALFRHGEIPFHNPYLLCGNPHLSNLQARHFEPLAVLLRRLDPARAVSWAVALHVALFALGTYLLARVLRLSRPAATLAVLAAALSGKVGAHVFAGHLSILGCTSWFPFQTASLHLLLRDRRWVAAPLLAAFLAFSFLAGQPQPLYYQCFLLAAYAAGLGILLAHEQRAVGGPLLAALGAGFLALGLAAAQLLPTARFHPHSLRGSAAWAQAAAPTAPGASGPRDLLQFLAPGAGIRPRPGEPDAANGFFWERTMTLGAVPLLFLLLSLPAARRRPVIGLSLLALLVAGAHALDIPAPLWRTLRGAVPGLAEFRNPGRIWFPVLPLLAVLAAIGLDQALPRTSDGARRRSRGLAAALLLAGVAAVAAGHWLAGRAGDRGIAAPWVPALAALTALAVLAAWIGHLRPRVAQMLVLAAAGLELAPGLAPLVNAAPAAQVLGSNVVVDALAAMPGAFRILDRSGAAAQERGIPRGLEYVDAQTEPMIPARLLDLFSLAQSGMPAPDLAALEDDFGLARRPALLGLAGFRYGVTALPQAAPWLTPRLVIGFGTPGGKEIRRVHVYENRLALPRAFAVGRAARIDDRGTRLAALAALDPRAAAIVEGDAPGIDGDLFAPARFVRLSPNRFLVGVRIERPAVLVVAEQFYPHWRASENGRELPVFPADHAFLGVALAAGSHIVRFEARPAEWPIARAATTASGLLALLLLLGGWVRERGQRRQPPAAWTRS